jgi:hypothetical protein
MAAWSAEKSVSPCLPTVQISPSMMQLTKPRAAFAISGKVLV